MFFISQLYFYLNFNDILLVIKKIMKSKSDVKRKISVFSWRSLGTDPLWSNASFNARSSNCSWTKLPSGVYITRKFCPKLSCCRTVLQPTHTTDPLQVVWVWTAGYFYSVKRTLKWRSQRTRATSHSRNGSKRKCAFCICLRQTWYRTRSRNHQKWWVTFAQMVFLWGDLAHFADYL